MGYKLYKGNQRIKKVFKGGTAVKKIYKGSTLIWQADPYPPGTVKLDVNAATGDQTIELEEGIYKIEAVGSGSSGNGAAVVAVGIIYYGGGGSGAAFVGEMKLPSGTYHYGIGSPNSGAPAYLCLGSASGDGVSAGGAQPSSFMRFAGNTGGVLSVTEDWIVGTPEVKSNGNQGVSSSGFSGAVAGGASLYNGKGAGGASEGSGGLGMLRVTYLRQ